MPRLEKPQGHTSRWDRLRRPTTMPSGVKATDTTPAPLSARILLNAVVTRTKSSSSVRVLGRFRT
jgi:hypothetical protein